MAVTRQLYTATATWTAAQAADIFRSAFIDSGHMTDWYDSFLSGTVENRVMQVVHDAGTYGTTYYWFQFTTTTIGFFTVNGWNAVSHIPSGTLYLDYLQTTTNATTGHYNFSVVSTTSLSLILFTSGINSSCSVFRISNGSANLNFTITRPGWDASNTVVDYSRMAFNGLMFIEQGGVTTQAACLSFGTTGCLRRNIYGQFVGGGTATAWMNQLIRFKRYAAQAASNTASNANQAGSTNYFEWLIISQNSWNTGMADNFIPIYTGIQPVIWYPSFPADFGLAVDIANSSIVKGDTYVVAAGTSEWEVIELGNNASSCRIMFVARTAG